MRELREKARLLLLANLRRGLGTHRGALQEYVYVCPSPAVYPHQWLWDSCFHSIVMARFDGEIAQAELRTLVSRLGADGFLPHLSCWGNGRRSLVPRAIAGFTDRLTHHSNLTQPPVLAIAVEKVVQHTGDLAFLANVLPRLKAYYGHLAHSRAVGGGKLLAILFPIESGMDHSPCYDAALGLRRPSAAQYHLANLLLIVHRRALGWDFARIAKSGRFVVKDVAFNCIYASGLRALARLLTSAGDAEAPCWERLADDVEGAIIEECHSAADRSFYGVSHGSGELLSVPTVGSLLPLLLERLPSERAAEIVAQIRNPRQFGTPCPVPSVSCSHASFSPRGARVESGKGVLALYRRLLARHQLIWRGPTWVNTNWLLTRGLRMHGYAAEADDLAIRTAEMVERAGFWEFYDPFSGRGMGAENFGWSTLAVDMLDDLDPVPSARPRAASAVGISRVAS